LCDTRARFTAFGGRGTRQTLKTVAPKPHTPEREQIAVGATCLLNPQKRSVGRVPPQSASG